MSAPLASPVLSSISAGESCGERVSGRAGCFRPGEGALHIERLSGKSRVTGCRAESPLRLLTPRVTGRATWIYTSTFGGGLLAGDEIKLDLTIGPNATAFLSTQSQTKIYRSIDGKVARQSFTARVAEHATLICLPDPVACFADAIFEQQQAIYLSPSSSLIWLEWLTSGRRARGERWKFERYASRADVRVGQELVFRDALRLDRTDGAIDAHQRMGGCECFATVLLLGPGMSAWAAEILKWVGRQPVGRNEATMFSASPIADGAVVRVAGPSAQAVGQWLRARLAFLPELLGADPWERKW